MQTFTYVFGVTNSRITTTIAHEKTELKNTKYMKERPELTVEKDFHSQSDLNRI